MDRVDKILNHNLFISTSTKIDEAEKDRSFCRHDRNHFLDVARIMRILNEEGHYGLSVELIYAAALLHDIGRFVQYASGVPHEVASAEIAAKILPDCEFDEKETAVIIDAIRMHRNKNSNSIADNQDGSSALGQILNRADKLSRPCFSCKAIAECNWPDDKKNLSLRY